MSADDSTARSAVPTGGTERARDQEGFLDRLLTRLRRRASNTLRDDLAEVLAEGETAAEFLPLERAMLQNVLALRTRRIQDVMVPRVDIVAVNQEIALGELLRVFRTAGHSRLPVYAETLDDPRGMVHIRDLVDYMAARAENGAGGRRRKAAAGMPDLGKIDLSTPLSAAKILRPVLFVPPSMPALDLLLKMQASRTHMALVIDEYGGTDGLLSIEDIVEIIVGDIEDEHDDHDGPPIIEGPGGSFLADARTPLDVASKAIGVDLEQSEDAEDVDTLGGLVASIAGRLPVRGEVIVHPAGFEFEVLDADPRRIKRLRIHMTPAAVETLALPAPTPPPADLATAPPAAGPDVPGPGKPDRPADGGA